MRYRREILEPWQPRYARPDPLDGLRRWRIGGTRLYAGDAREVLARLPEGSVRCCVTSPPYFGLRKYSGVEPTVWGGDDPACEHAWGDEIPQDARHRYTAENSGPKHTAANEGPKSRGAFCLCCKTAWLGTLGNEPSLDCGRPMAKLKSGLTEKQRAFVAQRLREEGLL